MAKKSTPKKDENIEFETFNEGSYFINNDKQDKPYCFNGIIGIRKYKVTKTLIEESIEVLQERLEQLWLESDNHHHHSPLMRMAKELNYEFKGERGSRRKK